MGISTAIPSGHLPILVHGFQADTATNGWSAQTAVHKTDYRILVVVANLDQVCDLEWLPPYAGRCRAAHLDHRHRSEEHTSELQSHA